MLSRLIRLTTALIFLSAAAQAAGQRSAVAQDGALHDVREGVWYGIAAGAGWDRLSCGVCAGERRGGIAGSARAGGTLSANWLLGGELNGWSNSSGGVNEHLVFVSAVAHWFPAPTGSVHFKGGLGYLAYAANDDEASLSTTAFGVQGGIGYDLPIARGVALTPSFSWTFAPFGDLTFNDTRIRGDVRSSFLQLGVGLTWY